MKRIEFYDPSGTQITDKCELRMTSSTPWFQEYAIDYKTDELYPGTEEKKTIGFIGTAGVHMKTPYSHKEFDSPREDDPRG